VRTADWWTIIVILGILVAVLAFDLWVRSRE
jgi:cbb3-type cytochrome oxidase subunit 3